MGSSGAMFLVDAYPDPGQLVTKTCDWMIWLNPCPFLNAKVCSSICPEQTTENSIQMVSALVLHIFKPLLINGCFIYFQKTLQKYISGKQVKEGWVLSVPYDAKHGVGTPYLKPSEGSSSTKGNRTIKR